MPSADTSSPPEPIDAAFAAALSGTAAERAAVFGRCREEAPVFRSATFDAWIVSRYDAVRAVLADEERFLPVSEGAGAVIFRPSFFHWRGREHSRKMGIVGRRIRSRKALADGVDAMTREVVQRVLDEVPLGEPVDLREAFTAPIPLLVITELLEVHEAARFRDWYRTMLAGSISSLTDPGARDAALAALDELRAFLQPIIAERRVRPGADIVSDLATATYDGEQLGDEEIGTIVAQLLTAGVETTERVLTSLLRHLALDPDGWAALRAARGDRDLLSSVSAEALRVWPPVQATSRTAVADAELDGVAVPAGDRLLALIVSANHDARRFAEPDRFEPRRFLPVPDRQFTAAGEILPFGAGTHHCTGSRLAEAEMVNALSGLLERVERIEPDGPLPEGEGALLHSPPALPVILHPS